MRVDLYTDASIVTRDKGRGAWAAIVLREGEERFEMSGPLRGKFQSSTATEIAAIANGLHRAIRLDLVRSGDEVVAWCDNTAAIWWANDRARIKATSDPRLIEARRFIRDARRRVHFRFEAKHIKGHQRLDTSDERAIYNMRCDELCSAIRDGVAARTWDDLAGRMRHARAMRERREAKREEMA